MRLVYTRHRTEYAVALYTARRSADQNRDGHVATQFEDAHARSEKRLLSTHTLPEAARRRVAMTLREPPTASL